MSAPMPHFFPFLLPPFLHRLRQFLRQTAAAMMSACPTAFSFEPLFFSSFEHDFPPWDFPDNFFADNYESSLPSNSKVSIEPSSPAADVVDERKRRRMLSNRESARRSRMRKQKHLENVWDQVSLLRLENQEISSRLVMFTSHGQRLCFENDQLRSDNVNLRQKLSEISQVLLIGQPSQQDELIASCNDINIINVMSEHNSSSVT